MTTNYRRYVTCKMFLHRITGRVEEYFSVHDEKEDRYIGEYGSFREAETEALRLEKNHENENWLLHNTEDEGTLKTIPVNAVLGLCLIILVVGFWIARVMF